MNTHYAALVFGGDFDGDHPDEELRGRGPDLSLIACGDEEFCWRAAARWTKDHPLRRDEAVEVLARDLDVVRDGQVSAAAFLEELRRQQDEERPGG